MTTDLEGRVFRVTGRVQGVGYRPWVYREALLLGLRGSVHNDRQGVSIEAWGTAPQLEALHTLLQRSGPPMSSAESVQAQAVPTGQAAPADFRIQASAAGTPGQCPTPDIATCADCLAELRDPASRRHAYPFTSCSQCGPRVSIQRALPWDRANTTMAGFPLCADCRTEYENPADRRYHAESLACPACGPTLWFRGTPGATVSGDAAALLSAVQLLRAGHILALKGTGGWQLVCDATRPETLRRLRNRKQRPHKPFALMARDLACVQRYCVGDSIAEQALTHPAAPIVLMDTLPNRLPEALAPGLQRLGFMLAHSPLHHLLLTTLDTPLVVTSGNVAGDPQLIEDSAAREQLAVIADGFLGHNREIAQRMDDSVVQVQVSGWQVLRAGRGLAPATHRWAQAPARHPTTLALGAHLKNTIAAVQQGRVLCSAHIGDLDAERTRMDAEQATTQFVDLLGEAPARVACDRHPDYQSSRTAARLAEQWHVPMHPVGHHHAHLAACLLEHGFPADTAPVLGIILDGLGYGEDGSLWGGEFLLGNYVQCQRMGTCKPVPLPGGTRALLEPWRNLLAHLHAELGLGWLRLNFSELPVSRFLLDPTRASLTSVLGDAALSPPASSCGRLFDAVAAAVGICRERISYEGQAAMELEACIDHSALLATGEEAAYPIAVPRLPGSRLPYLEPMMMWQALFGDLHLGTSPGVISARFHRGLANGITRLVRQLQTQGAEAAFHHVVLSGGVFQNRILLHLVKTDLESSGLQVLVSQQIPAGDGGIAAGQAVIAAAQED